MPEAFDAGPEARTVLPERSVTVPLGLVLDEVMRTFAIMFAAALTGFWASVSVVMVESSVIVTLPVAEVEDALSASPE